MHSTMRSKKLARINSKMSMAQSKKPKKRIGGGGVGGADSKIVSELQLNVKKLLEDVRKLKIFEHESGLTFRKIDGAIEEFKQKNIQFQDEHEKIKKKQEDIEKQHTNAMDELHEKTKKVEQIYKDIQKMINDFKKEYRYGFKKIIKCEVEINDLKTQVKFIRTKIIPQSKQKHLNKEQLIREIDGKFELLYDQVSAMASDQANFNIKIQHDQNKLQEPLEIEISKIRQEGDLMMRELERTQRANRDLIQSVINQPPFDKSAPKSNIYKYPSTAVSSTRGTRRHNFSFTDDYTKPSSRQVRYSTPSVTAVPKTRLKRFNFDSQKKDDTVPDFSHLVNRKSSKNKKNQEAQSVVDLTATSHIEPLEDIMEFLNTSNRANLKTAGNDMSTILNSKPKLQFNKMRRGHFRSKSKKY